VRGEGSLDICNLLEADKVPLGRDLGTIDRSLEVRKSRYAARRCSKSCDSRNRYSPCTYPIVKGSCNDPNIKRRASKTEQSNTEHAPLQARSRYSDRRFVEPDVCGRASEEVSPGATHLPS
jgi:hypothetical protein